MPSSNVLRVKRGDAFNYRIAFTLDDDPYDATGATVWLTFRKDKRDATAAAQLTSTAGHIVIDDDGGGADVAASWAALELAPGRYVYDVQIQKADWIGPKTTEDGHAVVDNDVTKEELP